MIATAVMWYSISQIFAAEAEFEELEPDDALPLYLTLGPLLLDGAAFYWLSQAVIA